ncbi:MAG: aminopeptidase P family N-terminal domain-containing protein, partial [Clostridiales bacterium]|nr:aminopeptidase P family N-terminal domain-containing protein [Clostridiales bacterium]
MDQLNNVCDLLPVSCPRERIEALRSLMRERGIAMYIVPTADYHNSEYAGEYFAKRRYLSGFTGSAGTLLVTMEEAGLWTDARYFIQAAQQLEGSGITLFKMREEGVPTLSEYIKEHLGEGQVIGFDGRTVSDSFGKEMSGIAEKVNGSLRVDEDLVDLIWPDRPKLSCEPAWVLEMEYSGESVADKLSRVRAKMKELGADLHLLSSLTDIAWLLNVRGNDVESVPVVVSYLALTADKCIWFVQDAALGEEVHAYLTENNIETRPYEDFYAYIEGLKADKSDEISVLIDTRSLNYRACSSIPEGIQIIDKPNPTELMKAVKNAVEAENIRRAHVKDAVAVCRFMYWLKTNIGKIPMTEISASDYLADLRAQQEGFIELSFDTICGYQEHGAIIHYSATEETNVELHPEGFLLVDSGGHYLEGTTDITRTFALGPITDEMRANFTRVCRSNINLANTRFLYGASGRNLDVVAREPMWEAGLDFKHGTGHGVGYVLSVHEGPNAFRWQNSVSSPECVLEEGMVTT